ncbi:UNVERIFIED_CONTAM: hypothetical protein Scaly_2421800 [Sesamum calycinum]|uniref:Transposase MuDR plant domain-containing protein n=1 Tax=Sesamum calycinum TaxID=2727403 RepID=A0AAW2M0Q1_9LAMI
MSNQWGEYMTLLATPRLPSCSNTDYLAGTSNPDFGAGTSNPNFGAEDPIGYSFANESDDASEPDEAEYPIPHEDGPNDVDINVMVEIFAQGMAETSSEPALPNRTTQPIFYRYIPFFEQTFPEIPADSVDVSNLRGQRGMCLISDRHGGIIKAVREGLDFVSPHGVHRYCLRHVCSNFNSNFKNVVLKDLCWQVGSEYQLRKFNRIMEEIKKQHVGAFAYLDQINKEKWTVSHDGGWRCGILTTKMSECINGFLKGVRRLPSQNTVTLNSPRRSLQGARMDMESTHMLSKLPTENAHAASGINSASLVLTLKNRKIIGITQIFSWSTILLSVFPRPGRNQTTRIHNEMDWRQTRARQEAQQQGDSSIQENMPEEDC